MRVIKPGFSEWIYLFANAFGFMADRLYPIEAFLVRKLFDNLPDNYKEPFRKQFDSYTTFQRGGWGWTQLLMYPKNLFMSRRAPMRSDLLVPTEKEDVRLASFKFRAPEQEGENNAVFHVVGGRLYTIDFGKDYLGWGIGKRA